MSIRWQVGQFLALVGLILLILYYVSMKTQSPVTLYFCSGLFLLLLGIYMMWRWRQPLEAGERFQLLRRLSTRRERKKEKKGGKEAEE